MREIVLNHLFDGKVISKNLMEKNAYNNDKFHALAYTGIKPRVFETPALHFDEAAPRVYAHAKCTDIYIYICLAITARGNSGTYSLASSRALGRLRLLFLLSSRALSQPDPDLRLRFRASARISPESRRGQGSGFAGLRDHGATVGFRGRGPPRGTATREERGQTRGRSK